MMPVPRPRSMILTFYGAFVRRLDGWVAVSHLIELMSQLELDQQAVRSSISRLKRRGWLVPSRQAGLAGYALSDVARAALEQADERIYTGPKPADPADGWGMVVFSVPENERHKRHLLRSRLTWLGFGHTAPGVWIAPRRLLPAARRQLEQLDLTGYVDLYEASHLGFGDIRHLVDRSWDLAALRELYAGFVADHRPVLARWRATTSDAAPRAAYVDYLAALDRWRALPFLDPGLPAELLPPGWEGHEAAGLFHELVGLLEEPAFAHVEATVTAEVPVTRSRSPRREFSGRPSAPGSG